MLIGERYAFEKVVKEKQLPPAEFQKLRQLYALPVMVRIHAWLTYQKQNALPKGALSFVILISSF